MNGKIDPYSIDDYLSHEGYAALADVLAGDDPDAVIELITESKLRGRGGAGFPTGVKWKFASQSKSDEKYIICNADEGDPGAFMDRSVLEGDPHAVLEGMIIGRVRDRRARGLRLRARRVSLRRRASACRPGAGA